MNHLAYRGCHIGRSHAGGIGPVANDELCSWYRPLQDGEEGGLLRIFGEQKIFARWHHADNLNRLAGAVLEVAADNLVRVKQAAGELLIHNGHRRRVRFVAKAEVASFEQLSLRGLEISRRDVEVKSIKCFVGVSEVGRLLRKDRYVRRVGEGCCVRVGRRFHSRKLRHLLQQLPLNMFRSVSRNNQPRSHRISSAQRYWD